MAKSNFDVKELLSKMTLQEKVGQLVQLNAVFFGQTAAEITGPAERWKLASKEVYNMGSVLNFHGAEEMKRIQDDYMAKNRHGIPLVFMMDVIHGYKTIFPIPLALGASFDPELVKECSRMAAKEASAAGVQLTFTPMVDYARDARWGRVLETCGEDPMLNGIMGAAQVEAFQGDDISDHNNLATCVKHFAAYGGAEAGRDYNTVELSERLLREYYLPAYKACVDAGTKMVMPSFNSLNGVPSVANKWLMNKVLREEWGFDGVVISDYNAVGELVKHGIAADMKEAAKLALEGGCDIEMMSISYYEHIPALIEEGVITEEQIDASVLKVLEFKKELGLFEDPYHGADEAKSKALCLCDEHREIVRRAAEQCAVLLKNNGVLPFSKDIKTIALIGPFADNNQIRGFWACDGKDEDCVTIAQGIKALLPNVKVIVERGCSEKIDELDKSGFKAAIKAAKKADAVVLCLGEFQKYAGEGNSRIDIGLTGVQQELANEVLAVNDNAAVVLFNGRPLALVELDAKAPAILDMFFPGTEGGNAVARLLFGDANPCGKVTMSFPKAVGQCPIYYNHPMTGRPKTKPENEHQGYASSYIGCGNLPLYPFGHGLSYSNFIYESLELDSDILTSDGEITVKITLKNDSDIAGKEVVQLYMRDLVASTVRPIQSLIAFEKIDLAANETKTVTFKVRESMLRFYDMDCNFISEPGEFTLSTGHADNLILTKSFTLK